MSEQKVKEEEKAKEEEKVEVKIKLTPIKKRTRDFIFEDLALLKVGEEVGFRPEDSVRVAVADKEEEEINPETQKMEKFKVIHAVSVSKEKLERLRDSLKGPFRLDGHVVKAVRPEHEIIADFLEMVPSPEELRKKVEALEEKVEKWKEETKKKS